jgi:hypothetical protein
MSIIMSRSAAALAALLAVGLTGCSADSGAQPRKATDLGQVSPYETAVMSDGATSLWPLRDADGLRPRDQVAELTSAHLTGTVVGGTISGTTSPAGARGALFLRGGRIVTPVTAGLSSRDSFTLELAVRADACTNAWGRVVGTSALTEHGREGLEVLHFPSQFQLNPCRLAVEFWHRGKHLGGCHPPAVPAIGRWVHLAVVYFERTVTCYEDGRVVGRQTLFAPGVFEQPGPLGIGGSGSGFQGPLDGVSLSEVAVYDRPLTLAQVRTHASLLRRPAAPA